MNIVIGVCGGIAAYKACDLILMFRNAGHNVDVIMTENACEFITPLTLQTLSRNPVTTEMFKEAPKWDVAHISVAKKADVFIVAPATANVIGKIASGIADDFLTTSIMATTSPIIVVPAMNTNMYQNAIVQENINKLTSLGYHFIEPAVGMLACGDLGKGTFPANDLIFEKAVKLLAKKTDLNGRKVLITAGPTREAIDPVRYITNHSSGKMGYSIAKAAKFRGAEVCLISGPVEIKKPNDVMIKSVVTAEDMYNAVLENYSEYDILIMVAAVADYKCDTVPKHKIKKTSEHLTLDLVKNPDIAKSIGAIKGNRLLVGFCAETESLIENAKIKITNKNFDIIVANDVSQPEAGFSVDTNVVSIINKFGDIETLPIMSKNDVANKIIDSIINFEQKF